MVSPEMAMLSVFMTPWIKPTFDPLRDQPRLAFGDAFEQGEEAARRADEAGVVAGDRVLGELAHALGIAAGSEELERADTDVARRDARQHRAGQHRLAQHRLAGGDDGERARGRNAERMHRLADEDLAQHRPDRRLAVAAARERRPARAFQSDVAPLAGAVDHFAEQDGAAVAELRREAAELMAGVGLRDRLGAFGHLVAGEDIRAGRAGQRGNVERPSSSASGALKKSDLGAGAASGRQGTEKPCRSRAYELSRRKGAMAAMGHRVVAASLNDFGAAMPRQEPIGWAPAAIDVAGIHHPFGREAVAAEETTT